MTIKFTFILQEKSPLVATPQIPNLPIHFQGGVSLPLRPHFVASYPLCGLKRRPQRLLKLMASSHIIIATAPERSLSLSKRASGSVQEEICHAELDSASVPIQNSSFLFEKPLPSFAPLCRVFRYPLCGIRSEASSGNPFAKPRNAPILNFKFNFEFKQSCHYRGEPDSDTFCVKSVYQKIVFLT